MQPTGHPNAGRGALSSPPGRFQNYIREKEISTVAESAGEATDIAWESEPESLRQDTTIIEEKARSILTKNDSPDVPFNRSINPYRGCEHGCIYCYARPSHAFVDLSPGRDFETKIFAKRNAAELLKKEFHKKTYTVDTIVLGSNTDPYQPAEKQERIVREILKLCVEYNHPVSITTKNALLLRDLDLITLLASRELISINLSITSLDPDLAHRWEPRASAPAQRLRALKSLRSAGVPAGVLLAPVVPGLNDREIEGIVAESAAAGALWLHHILLRLPYEVKDLFIEWLNRYYPEKKDRILHLIQSVRNGKANDPRFGHRMSGSGNYANLIHLRVRSSVHRAGIPGKVSAPRKDLFLRAAGGQPDLFANPCSD